MFLDGHGIYMRDIYSHGENIFSGLTSLVIYCLFINTKEFFFKYFAISYKNISLEIIEPWGFKSIFFWQPIKCGYFEIYLIFFLYFWQQVFKLGIFSDRFSCYCFFSDFSDDFWTPYWKLIFWTSCFQEALDQ